MRVRIANAEVAADQIITGWIRNRPLETGCRRDYTGLILVTVGHFPRDDVLISEQLPVNKDLGVERRLVHYTGHVQGVGFRYTTRSIAQQYEITGYVRNLDDGRVELLVEGSESVLSTFLEDLRSQMSDFIRRVHVEEGRATGEFNGFQIHS